MEKKASILVVDDEKGVRQSFNIVLKDNYQVFLAESISGALDIFAKNPIDVILLDIILPDGNGLDLIEKLKSMSLNTEIIMVTAVKEIQTAVKAIKLGAYDYIVKPFVVEEVKNIIHRALEKHRLIKEVTYLRNELRRYHPSEEIIGQSPKMRKVFELISSIAGSDGPVFVQGESGTGKEMVARAIHNLSPRKENPFVVINCAAIPKTLMESEIFGHVKGAFTGASRSTIGKLEMSHQGTAFLDDIDILDITMQAKLLRVVQEKEFTKLGSNQTIKVDVRFIASSNQNIPKLVSEGKFREDLYFRLNVFPVHLPPLRERKGDIPLLLNHFLEQQANRTGKATKRFSGKAQEMLTRHYNWPGNVRELQNLVERLFTITPKNVIYPRNLSSLNIDPSQTDGLPLKEAVSAFEREYINSVLETVNGSRTKASELLGIHRNTLLSKLREPDKKSKIEESYPNE
jgi:DNA-binding NtrC family response regulator